MMEDKRNDNFLLKQTMGRYAETVYKMIFAYTQDENVASNIFQKVFSDYVRTAPDFANEDEKKEWLLLKAVECLYSARKVREYVNLSVKQDEGLADKGTAQAEHRDIMKKFPKNYRLIIHLYFGEKMSISEIAYLTGCKEDLVRYRINIVKRVYRSTAGENI